MFGADASRPPGEAVVLLVGRVLLAAIFIPEGFHKLTGLAGFAEYLTHHGISVGAHPLAVLAALIELIGSLAVLVGFQTRCAALVMAVFTLAAAVIGHRFWQVDPAQYTNQKIHFMKDVAIVGGFLMLYVAGPGRWSVDRRGR